MTIKPCIYCPHRADCDIRSEKIKAVRGVGITTMTIKCLKLEAEYPPGAEVVVSTKVDTGGVDYEQCPIYEDAELLATVMKRRRTKILVAVHPGQSPTTRKPLMNVYPRKCRPTGNMRRVCIHCGKPEGIDLLAAPDSWDVEQGEKTPWRCRWNELEPGVVLPCEFGETAADSGAKE